MNNKNKSQERLDEEDEVKSSTVVRWQTRKEYISRGSSVDK